MKDEKLANFRWIKAKIAKSCQGLTPILINISCKKRLQTIINLFLLLSMDRSEVQKEVIQTTQEVGANLLVVFVDPSLEDRVFWSWLWMDIECRGVQSEE